MTADPPEIVLPVRGVVRASLVSVFRHLDNFVGRVWPWLAIVVAVTGVLGLGLGMDFEQDPSAQFALNACLLLGSTMIAVSWHRGLLLGEPGGPDSAFRFDRPFWRYIGTAILAALLVIAGVGVPAVVFVLAFVGLLGQQAAAGAAAVPLIVLVFAILPIVCRLIPALPMAAIGAPAPLLRGAWRLTRGNGWRILGALLVVSLVGSLIQAAVILVVGLAAGLASVILADGESVLQGALFHLVVQPLVVVSALLNAALFASFASYTYAVLAGHPLGREATG